MFLPEGVRMRLATAADAEAIFVFDPIAAVAGSRRAFVRRSICERCCHVAEADGRVVAYAVIDNTFYGHGFIPLLYVANDCRRHGIGSALVRHVELACASPKLFSSTNESNVPMRQLLSKLGFVPSGVIENLDEGDPEIVYFKRLR